MSDDIPIGVAGGAAGTAAVTQDLEVAARIVADAALSVEEAATHLARAAALLDDARPHAEGDVAVALVRADDDVGAARWGFGGVGVLARELDDVADRLVAVAAAYADAEAHARGGIAVAESAHRFVGDALATLAWLGRLRLAWGWKVTVPGVLATVVGEDRIGPALAPDGPPPMTGYLNRGTTGVVTGGLRSSGPPWLRHYEAVVLALRGAITAGEIAAGEPRIARAVAVGSPADVDPPRGMEGIAAGLAELSMPPDGVVAIDRLSTREGDAFVVTIPGTYDNGLTSINPFDWGGNVDVVDGKVSDAMRFALSAMEEMRIPAGAPVMIVGHSQGGLVATALAGLDEVRERFTVTDVVTFGSPTAALPHPDGVTYAHVEDVSDAVPALDGAANREAANVTTWTGDARASATPQVVAAATGVVSVHGMATYRATASAIDRLADPCTRAWRERASRFLTASGAQRTMFGPVPVGQATPPVRPGANAAVSPGSRP